MRRRPRAAEAAAAAVILGGTLMASGMFSESVGALDPVGIACGLLSAVSCTFFMFFSSRVGRGMPSVQRGLVVCLGACALGFAVPRLLRKRRSAGRHLEVRPRSGTMRAVRAGSAVRHRHAAPDTGGWLPSWHPPSFPAASPCRRSCWASRLKRSRSPASLPSWPGIVISQLPHLGRRRTSAKGEAPGAAPGASRRPRGALGEKRPAADRARRPRRARTARRVVVG